MQHTSPYDEAQQLTGIRREVESLQKGRYTAEMDTALVSHSRYCSPQYCIWYTVLYRLLSKTVGTKKKLQKLKQNLPLYTAHY